MAELLQDVLGDAGRGSKHLAVGGGHGGGKDARQNQARQNGCQNAVLCNEVCNADDDRLAGGAAQVLQRACLGHAKAHHADDDGGGHGNDDPHAGNAAAEYQLLFILNGHEAEQDVGHSEVAQAPRHGGDDVHQAVRGGRTLGGVVAGHHGQVAGQALGVGHNGIPAARRANAVHQHSHKGQAHHDGLDEVCGGNGAETARDGIAHDDAGRDHHGRHVIHAEQAVEQLAASGKARSRVGHKEHDDDHRAQCVEQIALVVEAQGQELRHGDGFQIGRIPPQPPGHDEPVQPGAQRQADGGPAGRGDAGEVGKTRHSHQQPAGHIAGFGAHGRDQRAHFAAAEVEIGAVVVGLAVCKPNQQHCHQIDDDGGDDADVGHILFPPCLSK